MKKILYLHIFLFIGCNSSVETNGLSNEYNTTEGENILVKTQKIPEQSFNQQIISNGKIEALQKADLQFKMSERLAIIQVKNGQKVREKQLLAQLDNEILLNQLNKAKIELDIAKSKLREEKIKYGLSTASDRDIDQVILKNLYIKSGLSKARNALQNAQIQYSQSFLKAPFNGVIANLEAKAGNYISSGDIFCTVISQNNMEVSFQVLEHERSFVKKGQPVEIISFVNEKEKYKGIITEINPVIDKNGLVKIKAKMVKSGDNTPLFDGTNVKVFINRSIDNVIVIPKKALVLRSNRAVAFTVEHGLAKWNYVEILDENATSYAIKKGLKKGDTIIVSGHLNLSHDTKVSTTPIIPEYAN